MRLAKRSVTGIIRRLICLKKGGFAPDSPVDQMQLSIVMPAYNEERRLAANLERYAAYFSGRYGPEAELIVVVNGSTDGTADVARALAARLPIVRVMVDPRPIGKGGAVMKGFRAAAGNAVGFVDADGSTAPEAFDDLVHNLGDAGVIIASRWIAGAIVEPRQPLKRRVASRLFNALVRILFAMKVRDTQCGAKLLSRAALDAVLPHLGITRWAFDVDLLFQLHRRGYRIKEWPTVWRDAEGSRLRVLRASLEMFVAMVRLRLLYSPMRWVVGVYDATMGRWTHRAR